MKEPNFIEYLSGGNHELFHTNLLAYIARKYPMYFISIFQEEVGNKLNGYNQNQDVEREENHFDLAIKRDKHYVFVLENKMKSIPDPAQLSRYFNKSKEAVHVLLTMIEVKQEDVTPWIQVKYGELAKRMEEGLKGQVFQGYFKLFLEDYISYISDLSNKIEKLNFDGRKSAKDWLGEKTNLNDCLTWESLYIQKARFQILAEEIKNKYNKSLICNAGIVRACTPFIDIWPVLRECSKKNISNQIQEWKKFTKTYKCNQYWCQIYSDHIERGFLVYYDSVDSVSLNNIRSKPVNTRKAETRYPFLKSVWDFCLKAQGLKDVAEKLKLNEKFEKNRQNCESKALLGYIYPDYIMVYVRSEFENEYLKQLVEMISEELNTVHTILSQLYKTI